jgi:hypothetical protein
MVDALKGRGHEGDHAHKHETDFRIAARRNKLFGFWAAELMNVTGPAADDYAKQVVSADLQEAGDDDVIRKVMADLEAKKVTMTREQLYAKLNGFQEEAKRQLAGA